MNYGTAILAWSDPFQSGSWIFSVWIVLAAYALGCCSTGYYLVRCRTGQDVRLLGSGNAGAKNVGRVLGWLGFAVTLAGDLAKGALAVWVAQRFTSDPQVIAIAVFSVVAGHVWPVQLGFRGGKGVATFLGAVSTYDARLALAFILFFGGFYVVMRRSVLPGLLAIALLPLAAWGLSPEPFSAGAAAEAFRMSCLASVILLVHRRNIGEELMLLAKCRNFARKRPTNS